MTKVQLFQTLIIFAILGAFGGWAVAFFSELGTHAQSAYTGRGLAVGVVAGLIYWAIARRKSLNDKAGS